MGDRQSGSEKLRPARHAIVVMGVSGSGKSTLGRLLAGELKCRFIEGDELHAPSSIEKMRNGEALTDFDRWPWLERLGKALRQASEADGLAVCACSALKYRYRKKLGDMVAAPTFFIMLEADREELSRRLDRREGHYMPASLLTSQLEALERPQAFERALILDAAQTPAALCRASSEWLERQG